jgi:phospholipase/carboxylesterase
LITGIHHITLITRKVQANVDFYAGFLGLRLVKRTGGFEDASQLHLFYGDRSGSPGSLITFLVWEDGAPGRAGHGQVGEIALAIDPASMGFWLERTLRHHIHTSAPSVEFGETVLRLRDPDGIAVKLVGSSMPASDPWTAPGLGQHSIRRIRGAMILSEAPEDTSAFISRHFGFESQARLETTERLISHSNDVIDIRNARGFWPGAPGTGIADHVAFRARDLSDLRRVEQGLVSANSSLTNLRDRKYFTSLYVREPAGTLLELATDGPGFTVDEPVEDLGNQLFLPPQVARDQADDIAAMLPQFSLPGEPRVIYRHLTFIHRFNTPVDPDGTTFVLLHGTGGSEADLMPLARTLAPHATLLGVRGRSTDEGILRWFRRLTPTSFDQADIRDEAGAFDAFLAEASEAYGLIADRMVFLGYSNGANLLAAMMLLHPGRVRRAILLRPMLVLEQAPVADLGQCRVLMVSGSDDPYRAMAPSLEEALRHSGADLETRIIDAGHGLSDADREIVSAWLKA